MSGFSSIAFKSEGKVTVQQTGKESLTISAEDNLLPLLESSVTNGILSIAKINVRRSVYGEDDIIFLKSKSKS